MKLLDDNLFTDVQDDARAPGELGEEDKDFLRMLEKMVEEVVEDKSDKPN